MPNDQEIVDVSQEIPSAAARTSNLQPPAYGVDFWTLLTDPEYLRDPYPQLKRIRELAPIHFDSTTGIYFVLGYEEFGRMARSRDLGRDIRVWTHSWNSEENRRRDPAAYALFHEFQPQMINANPPDHRRMRGVFEKAFRPQTWRNTSP